MAKTYWKDPKKELPKPHTNCYCNCGHFEIILTFENSNSWVSDDFQYYNNEDIVKFIEISELNKLLQNGCEKCRNYELEYDDKYD